MARTETLTSHLVCVRVVKESLGEDVRNLSEMFIGVQVDRPERLPTQHLSVLGGVSVQSLGSVPCGDTVSSPVQDEYRRDTGIHSV